MNGEEYDDLYVWFIAATRRISVLAAERDEALEALRLAEAAMVDLGACDDCAHVDCAQPLLRVRAVLAQHPKVNS